MVVVSTALLFLHTMVSPIGQVVAQTIEDTQEKAEQSTLPEIDTYFPIDETLEPRVFFSQSRLEGMVGEPINVTVLANQEISELQVRLPEEAEILTDQLPVGLSIHPSEQPHEWWIRSVRNQQTFVLPIFFEDAGTYEVSIEDKEVVLEINPATKEEPAIDQEEDHDSTEETFESEKAIDSDEEPSVIGQSLNPANEEEPADEEQEERFEGEVAEVNTFEEFRLAVADPTISQIEVRNNLTRSGTGAATAIGTLNRSLVINGNGFTINFGADNGSLNLGTLSDTAAVIRVQNATITKTGATPIFNASGTGLGWTLELEDITEGSANAARLALLSEGKVIFTGGTNQFVRTSVTNVFLQAKHIEARGSAQVTISRGNSGIFFSAATVTQPKIVIREQANISITTASGTGVPIDLRGSDAEIEVSETANLQVQTQGTTAAATNTTNNAIAMTGSNPTLSVTGGSNVQVNTTNAKRGIVLIGSTPSFVVENSSLSLTSVNGDALTTSGVDSKITITNSTIDLITTSGRGITSVGNTGLLENFKSEINFRSTTGELIRFTGVDPVVKLMNSQIVSTNTGSANGITLFGRNASLELEDGSNLELMGSGGVTENILIGNGEVDPTIKVSNKSRLSILTSSSSSAATNTSNNAVRLNGNNASVEISGSSKVEIGIESGARRGVFLNGTGADLIVSDSKLVTETLTGQGLSIGGNDIGLTVTSASEVNMNSTTGNSIAMTGNNASLTVERASQVNTTTGAADSIRLIGNAPTLKVVDEGTVVEATSHYTSNTNDTATINVGSGTADTRIENYLVEVGNHAELIVQANVSSGLIMQGNNGRFDVYNQADVQLLSGSYNAIGTGTTGNANASLRFVRSGTAANSGGNTFTLDNARMTIEKGGGNAAAVRMYGSNNHIHVLNKGEFIVTNPGNSTGLNGGEAGRNQGIHYTGNPSNNNSFTVRDPGSRVDIQADFGPAIDMAGTGEIHATNAGFFQASGRTSTAAGGIFNAGVLTVTFDDPLFMDFRNNRPGGGNLFNVSTGSTLTATNSDLAVWRNGVDLDGDPDLNFRKIGYSFSGANFNTLASTSDPDQLNTGVFGTSGLTAYSRMSSNNGRWAIADELRVPTNADKKIHGRISIPVGLDDSRPAWDDEAIVTVEVTPPTGEPKEYTTKTVGDSDESPGISIYGEEPRGGLFEIDLDEPLEAGSIVRIKEVALTSGELTDGFSHQILTDPVEVFPIIPPTPAQFTSSILAPNTAVIEGVTDDQDAEVTVTHNGEVLDTSDVTIAQDGRFTLDLNGVTLEEDDEIQVFLRDAKGSASASGVINPPETNNDRGNINPATELTFRDVTFEPATTLVVGDIGPVSPVDPLAPEFEVEPENKPELPEDQGPLSIDFISTFDFGSQAISAHGQTYYAQPQRLLNEDGTVNEEEERPNYVQISDRRPEDARNGWGLAVTQKEQFKGEDNQELLGARISLSNQQVITAQGGTPPGLQSVPCELIPGTKRTLLKAQGTEGTGTWIYRFGDAQTAGESVALVVPKGANPERTTYSTTLVWELSAVPGN